MIARGVIVRTVGDAKATLVLANETSLVLAPRTELKVDKFDQEPFKPNNNLSIEPSNSQTVVLLHSGQLDIDTPQLLSGTSLVFETAHGAISILNNQSGGEKASIAATEKQTHVQMVQGQATVRPRQPDGAFVSIGYTLKTKQQAIVKPTLGSNPHLNPAAFAATQAPVNGFAVTSGHGRAVDLERRRPDRPPAPRRHPPRGRGQHQDRRRRQGDAPLRQRCQPFAIGPNTEFKVEKFAQAPFTESGALGVEPSGSQTLIQLQAGTVDLDAPQLLNGSSLVFRDAPFVRPDPAAPGGRQPGHPHRDRAEHEVPGMALGQAEIHSRAADGSFVAAGTIVKPGDLALVKPVSGATGAAGEADASITTVLVDAPPAAPAGTIPSVVAGQAVALRVAGIVHYQVSADLPSSRPS